MARVRMSKFTLGFAAAAFIAVMSLGASPAAAITYHYLGQPFAAFADGPYTTSDLVAGDVTLAAALSNAPGGQIVTPTAFSFSDGVQTISDATATMASFEFETDILGNIIGWAVNLTAASGGIETQNEGGTATDSVYAIGGQGQNMDEAGTWTVVTTTPIPATLPLLASGLGAMGLLGWRKRARQQA